MIDSPAIVIHTQAELDRLLKQTYNRKLKRCVIDKSLKLVSTDSNYWLKSDAAFFKYDVECRNIYSPDISITSNGDITARTIIVRNIPHLNNLNARHIYCSNHVRVNAITAWTIQAQYIESDSITICSHHYEHFYANISTEIADKAN